MADDRVPEIACSTGGTWVLRIPTAGVEDYSPGKGHRVVGVAIELPLAPLLEHVRQNIPHLWVAVDAAVGKKEPIS